MASRREGRVMTDFIDLIMSSSNRSRRDVPRFFKIYVSVNNAAMVRVAHSSVTAEISLQSLALVRLVANN